MALPIIYEYYDYRKYLTDFYEAKRKDAAWFSYRYMSQKIGIDHAFLIRVLHGRRHIPLKQVPGFAEFLCLSTRKAEYFELMVLFSRAKSDRESKHYFEKMLGFSELPAKKVDADSYEYYRHWYYTAVRELLNIYPFDGDCSRLASKLMPPIHASEAKKAIELLERLGFICRSVTGTWELTAKFITTGDTWRSLAVRHYQKEAIELAATALESVPKEERNISTVSVSMDSRDIEQVNEIVRKFHNDIVSVARQAKNGDRVYQVNVQIFPLSARIENEARK